MDHSIERLLLLAASSLVCCSAAFAATPSGAAPGAGSHGPLFGFTADESGAQESVEQRFDSDLNPADLSAWMKNLSSEANQVGSPHDKANAEFVRDQLKQWGWDAQIEVFYPLYPTLKAAHPRARGADEVRGLSQGAAGGGR